MFHYISGKLAAAKSIVGIVMGKTSGKGNPVIINRLLEEELKTLPEGEKIANIPVLVSMVKSYIKKEYTAFPMHTLVSIVALLLYWFAPKDIIPDKIPVWGKTDDIFALTIVLRGVEKDVEAYKAWKKGEVNKPLF